MSSSPEGRRCPACGKPEVREHRPFCSRRCHDIDLGRWLKGTYVIPGSGRADDGESPHPPDDSSDDA